MSTRDFSVIDKNVGETPLQALERFRRATRRNLTNVPLAYAGRLDPMASGKLLILIGDECKKQKEYHGLDKEYIFEVLFGASSDTGDVLGILKPPIPSTPASPRPGLGETTDATLSPKVTLRLEDVSNICKKLVGSITLPYPHFSSKTVQGKPLHTWTLEGRIDEIEIPTYTSEIYRLDLLNIGEAPIDALYEHVSKKIETIPRVDDMKKALGGDFRRPAVRASWKAFHDARTHESYTIAQFRCVCSSGTYMRSLAEVIAGKLDTTGLAYSIHRSKIGQYRTLPFGVGFWSKQF